MITKTISKNRLSKQARDILTAISGKGYIAGGYARDVILGTHTASDIDIFFYDGPNRKVTVEPDDSGPSDESTIWTPYGPIVDDLRNLGYKFTRSLPNAWEFIMPRKDGKHNKNYYKVQVIQPFQSQWMKTFGTVEQVIGQFDFTVVKAAIYTSEVHVDSREPDNIRQLAGIRYFSFEHEDFHKDNKRKRLIITHINCPIAVSMRVNKYCSKGFYIGPKELIKLFKEWDSRDKTYKDRLIQLATQDSLDPKEWWEIEELLRID